MERGKMMSVTDGSSTDLTPCPLRLREGGTTRAIVRRLTPLP
jgi:hypothetical protein